MEHVREHVRRIRMYPLARKNGLGRLPEYNYLFPEYLQIMGKEVSSIEVLLSYGIASLSRKL